MAALTIHANGQPDWLDTTLYPFESKFIELPEGKMHYIDEGEGDILLFVHGTPTWSFLYREHIKELSKNYRCIAIDHLGFGLSDKPLNFSGSPQAHSKNLNLFIETLGLKKVNLVVHDFGGPIGLSWAIENPEMVNKIVLFNTWLWETKTNEQALKVDKIIRSGLGRFLYLRLNFSPKVLLKKGFTDKRKLTKNIHQHYTNPFPNKDSRQSLLKIGEALVGSSDWYKEQWSNLDQLEGKPILILWGNKDEFITPTYLQKWKNRLPNAKIIEFECGHFVQEEKTEDSIKEIDSFLKN